MLQTVRFGKALAEVRRSLKELQRDNEKLVEESEVWMATASTVRCTAYSLYRLLLFNCLLSNRFTLVQTAASLLEHLQNTADKDQKEWEAFAQKMYDEVGKARAARNMLQRYDRGVLSQCCQLCRCTSSTPKQICQRRGCMFNHTRHICSMCTSKTSLQ